MARRIEHHSTSGWPVAGVYGALVDPEYLRDRLHELGGKDTEIVEHAATESGVRYAVRQGVSVDSLPSIVRHAVGGDLIIDRTESWRRADENHCTGEIAAQVAGLPCSITGSMWLRDLPADPAGSGSASSASNGPAGSELIVEGGVRVSIPLVSSKIENLAVDQLQDLLASEAEFTADWLSRHA